MVWGCCWQRRICVPAVTGAAWSRGEGSASWEPAWLLDRGRDPRLAQQGPADVSGVSSPRLWPRFPSALEKEWKEVRQAETGSRASRFPLDAAVPVPTSSPTCSRGRTSAWPAAIPPTTSLPLLLTHCLTPCDFGQTFSPDLTGFPEFPATFHLHSAPIQCSPSPFPPPMASPLPATLHCPLSPAMSCHFWRGKRCVVTSGSSKDCLTAGLDPREQGWGVAAASVPCRCSRRSCCMGGGLAPETAPKPGTAHHGPILAPGMLFPEF